MREHNMSFLIERAKSFLATGLSLALIAQTVPAAPLAAPSSFSSFALPAHVGEITASFTPVGTGTVPSGAFKRVPDVVLIQDLHVNRSVQLNISKILHSVKSAGWLPQEIAIEGATGPVDVDFMQKTPDATVRKQAADYLVSQGEMAGDMHFVVTEGSGKLYGIETPEVYDSVIELYRKSYSQRTDLDKQLGELERALHYLSRDHNGTVRDNTAQLQQDVQLLTKLVRQQIPVDELSRSLRQAMLAVDHLQMVLPTDQARALLPPLSAAINYYTLALMRNDEMFKNLKALRSAEHQTTSVLVVGGFHTPGLTDLLKKENLSFIVITPNVQKMDHVDEKLYLERMLGNHFTPEQMAQGQDWALMLTRPPLVALSILQLMWNGRVRGLLRAHSLGIFGGILIAAGSYIGIGALNTGSAQTKDPSIAQGLPSEKHPALPAADNNLSLDPVSQEASRLIQQVGRYPFNKFNPYETESQLAIRIAAQLDQLIWLVAEGRILDPDTEKSAIHLMMRMYSSPIGYSNGNAGSVRLQNPLLVKLIKGDYPHHPARWESDPALVQFRAGLKADEATQLAAKKAADETTKSILEFAGMIGGLLTAFFTGRSLKQAKAWSVKPAFLIVAGFAVAGVAGVAHYGIEVLPFIFIFSGVGIFSLFQNYRSRGKGGTKARILIPFLLVASFFGGLQPKAMAMGESAPVKVNMYIDPATHLRQLIPALEAQMRQRMELARTGIQTPSFDEQIAKTKAEIASYAHLPDAHETVATSQIAYYERAKNARGALHDTLQELSTWLFNLHMYPVRTISTKASYGDLQIVDEALQRDYWYSNLNETRSEVIRSALREGISNPGNLRAALAYLIRASLSGESAEFSGPVSNFKVLMQITDPSALSMMAVEVKAELNNVSKNFADFQENPTEYTFYPEYFQTLMDLLQKASLSDFAAYNQRFEIQAIKKYLQSETERKNQEKITAFKWIFRVVSPLAILAGFFSRRNKNPNDVWPLAGATLFAGALVVVMAGLVWGIMPATLIVVLGLSAYFFRSQWIPSRLRKFMPILLIALLAPLAGLQPKAMAMGESAPVKVNMYIDPTWHLEQLISNLDSETKSLVYTEKWGGETAGIDDQIAKTKAEIVAYKNLPGANEVVMKRQRNFYDRAQIAQGRLKKKLQDLSAWLFNVYAHPAWALSTKASYGDLPIVSEALSKDYWSSDRGETRSEVVRTAVREGISNPGNLHAALANLVGQSLSGEHSEYSNPVSNFEVLMQIKDSSALAIMAEEVKAELNNIFIQFKNFQENPSEFGFNPDYFQTMMNLLEKASARDFAAYNQRSEIQAIKSYLQSEKDRKAQEKITGFKWFFGATSLLTLLAGYFSIKIRGADDKKLLRILTGVFGAASVLAIGFVWGLMPATIIALVAVALIGFALFRKYRTSKSVAIIPVLLLAAFFGGDLHRGLSQSAPMAVPVSVGNTSVSFPHPIHLEEMMFGIIDDLETAMREKNDSKIKELQAQLEEMIQWPGGYGTLSYILADYEYNGYSRERRSLTHNLLMQEFKSQRRAPAHSAVDTEVVKEIDAEASHLLEGSAEIFAARLKAHVREGIPDPTVRLFAIEMLLHVGLNLRSSPPYPYKYEIAIGDFINHRMKAESSREMMAERVRIRIEETEQEMRKNIAAHGGEFIPNVGLPFNLHSQLMEIWELNDPAAAQAHRQSEAYVALVQNLHSYEGKLMRVSLGMLGLFSFAGLTALGIWLRNLLKNRRLASTQRSANRREAGVINPFTISLLGLVSSVGLAVLTALTKAGRDHLSSGFEIVHQAALAVLSAHQTDLSFLFAPSFSAVVGFGALAALVVAEIILRNNSNTKAKADAKGMRPKLMVVGMLSVIPHTIAELGTASLGYISNLWVRRRVQNNAAAMFSRAQEAMAA